MFSSSVINFILLVIAFYSVCCLSSSPAPNTKPNSFILPIKKDSATNLFYTSIGIGTPRHDFNLVIDLSGENLWYDCDTNYNSSTYHPVPCGSKRCPDVTCLGCTGRIKPGCTNNTCPTDIPNQFAWSSYFAGLSDDIIFLSQRQVTGLLSACIDSDTFSSDDGSPLTGLPKSSKGIIGFARSQLVLPIQLAELKNLPTKFSLCFPSSNKQGFTNLLVDDKGQGQHPLPFSKFLQTTPLIMNSASPRISSPSKEYFIDVKSVKIDGQVLNLKPSLLSIDKNGNGGTKISTMSPFTGLQSTVYKIFVRDYLKKASERRLKRVASVPPFEACFDSTTIGNSVSVPSIDLVLQEGVKWTIHASNSMVMAKKNVACLAFVDGGTEPISSFIKASIVIGGYQLQDNLLVFDLASSKLSFSSSLLLHNASCSQ